MIDPKLNEIPVNKADVLDDDDFDPTLTSGTRAANAKPRPGLSINDTIAGSANLSVGARGVDTSGVRAGSGAGGGSTYLTPGNTGDSPAPDVVGGSRGSGTTVLGEAIPDETPTRSVTPVTEETVSAQQNYDPTYEEIAAHANRCWQERGCPDDGSSHEDWYRAERELRMRGRVPKSSTASA